MTLDIGTGGFNTTNYPNAIYGSSNHSSTAYEVPNVVKVECL